MMHALTALKLNITEINLPHGKWVLFNHNIHPLCPWIASCWRKMCWLLIVFYGNSLWERDVYYLCQMTFKLIPRDMSWFVSKVLWIDHVYVIIKGSQTKKLFKHRLKVTVLLLGDLGSLHKLYSLETKVSLSFNVTYVWPRRIENHHSL